MRMVEARFVCSFSFYFWTFLVHWGDYSFFPGVRIYASLLDFIKESFQGLRDSIRGMLQYSCRNIIRSGCFCNIKINENFDQEIFVNSKIIDDDVSFVGKRLNRTTGLVENCGKKGIEKLSLYRRICCSVTQVLDTGRNTIAS